MGLSEDGGHKAQAGNQLIEKPAFGVAAGTIESRPSGSVILRRACHNRM